MRAKSWKKLKKQVMAMILSLAMIGTSLDVSMFVYASQMTPAESDVVSKNSISGILVSENTTEIVAVTEPEKQSDVMPEKTVTTHDLSTGSVTFTDACGDNCPGHVITGSYAFTGKENSSIRYTSINYINVESGKHKITLQDAMIDYSAANYNGYGNYIKCCFSVSDSAIVDLKLEGTNVLNSGWNAPGIRVCEGGTLNIVDSPGRLDVSGGGYCAGIGGAYEEKIDGKCTNQCGEIIIAGGTIYAIGGFDGAGIGTGYNVPDCDVTITGGTIHAVGGSSAAGIGTGLQGYGYQAVDNIDGCTIKIAGGNICAFGDCNAAAMNVGLGRAAKYPLSLTNMASVPANVYAVNLTLSGVADGTEIASVDGPVDFDYGLSGVKTIGEKLCMYVPAGTTITSVTTKSGQIFTGSVTANASKEAASIFFANKEPKKDPTIILEDKLILGKTGDMLTYVMGNVSGAYAGTLHIVGGSKTDCNIGILEGAHCIALDGVEIDLLDINGSKRMEDGSPLYICSGASANITLLRENVMTAGSWAAAVQVRSGAKVIFDGNGKLYAKNRARQYDFDNEGIGAVIGAGYEGGCGEVVINGGNFYLRNNGSGAGIGGSGQADQYAGGTVTINGGNINIEVFKNDAQRIGYGSNGQTNSEIPKSGTVKNNAGEELYLSQIELVGFNGSGSEILAFGTMEYNFSGMQVIEGKLCMYLPAGETITSVTVGDQVFTGKLITKEEETAVVFRSKTVPEINNPVVKLNSDLILSKEGNDLYYQCDNVYCKYTGNITVTGNTSEYGIRVKGGAHKVILDGVIIDQSINPSGKVVDLSEGAALELILKGKNKLYAHDDCEAIRVPSGTSLKISGDGSLNTKGRPAIGCFDEKLGTIEIQGGTIRANGRRGSAAIGTGYKETTGGGRITINGGTIYAIAGECSAAIGTGGLESEFFNNSTGIDIIITGGNIYAKGSNFEDVTSDDIGNGNGGSGTTVCDANGNSLCMTQLTLSGVVEGDVVCAITLSEVVPYSVSGMKVLFDEKLSAGKVYVYLPEGVRVTGVEAGGLSYEVSAGYAGEKLTASHTHRWSCSAEGDTLTAECTSSTGTCSSKTNSVKIVSPNEKSLIYDGCEKTAYLTGNIPGKSLNVTYKKLNGDEWIDIEGAPIEGGDYRACVTMGSHTAYVEYTIKEIIDVEIIQVPTASAITYGQLLSDSMLSHGIVKARKKLIEGSFAWETPGTKPTVRTASDSGYRVIFTPEDSKIAPVSAYVKLTVNKAQIPNNKPAATISTDVSLLKDVILPTGWVWKNADLNRNLVYGSDAKYTAEYIAEDKDNYVTTAVDVTIKKRTCAHSWDAGVVTKAATALEAGVKQHRCSVCKNTKTSVIAKLAMPKKGKTYTSDNALAKYKVTKAAKKNGTVEYVMPINKKAKKVEVPASVKIHGVTYKVTSIAKNAFAKNKKITTLTIGKNVKKIGTKAFYKCSKLKKITIKTTKLTSKTVGKNAFKGIHKKATIKVPKKKLNAYKKVLKKRGVGTIAKITK